MTTGTVYLVGAGPGDPALLSLRGLECLKRADVVVYDRLVDDGLLDSCPEGTERLYVGKAAGNHTRPQNEISALLVARAAEGKTVVRLKGGDPFVLGRGGEEAEELVLNGVPFEVVPGVTSAVAVPAYAGIPVTHRNVASSFAVITGHEDPRKEDSSINWKGLALGPDTLVFLMGLKTLPDIASKLVEHGRPADTPVAVIRDGTTPEQVTVTGTLETIAGAVGNAGLAPPVVIVVGRVVALRERLRWFDNRPLFGKRVLVTRARTQAGALSRLLAERGARPVELPAIDIRYSPDNPPLAEAVRSLSQYDWAMFTSVNGVAAFWDQLNAAGLDSRALKGLRVGAIGPATAGALSERGIAADYVPEVFTSEAILEGLSAMDVQGMTFLLPRADKADAGLVEGIARLGGDVREIVAYRTERPCESQAAARQLLMAGKIDVITFTSSSTVTNLVSFFGEGQSPVNGAVVACIGPRTAETASAAGLKVDVTADEQTIPGLVNAIERYFGGHR